jgi:DNA-binding transcriptional LysR family regulator
MDVSVRNMEVLRAVLLTGGMTAASRRLGITQPAVSRIIAQVERQIGVRLFVKTGRSVTPTPEAVELGARIEDVFERVDVVHRLGRSLRNGGGRRIRIAVTPALTATLLPVPLARMRQRFPDVQVVVKMREMGAVETPTLDKDFDVCVAYNMLQLPDVISHVICSAPVVCYLPRGHRLAARSEVSAADLAGEEIISFNVGSRLGEPVEQAFAAAGLPWRPGIQTGNSTICAPLVRQGVGIAIADPFVWGSGDLDGLEVRPLTPRIALTPHVFHARSHSPSAPETCFLEELLRSAKAWVRSFEDALERQRPAAA